MASVKRVGDIMTGISAASQEQSVGIEEIVQAISQIDEMIRQNSALVEHAVAAAESMSEQTEHLTEALGAFKLTESASVATPLGRMALISNQSTPSSK